MATKQRDLGFLAQLRREHVREYEEDEAGNVRVVFDDSAFAPDPAAKPKDKPVALPGGAHSAAIIALKGRDYEPAR